MTKKYVRFTPEMDEIIIKRYPHEHAKDIAADMGLESRQVQSRASLLGVVRTEEYKQKKRELLRTIGKATHFQKGNPAHTGSRKKKVPRRITHPVGAVRVNSSGYIEKKMTTGRGHAADWVPVHKLVWEETNGPIPDGKIIAFVDGNKRNVALENLICVTNEENLKRVNINSYPPDIREAIKTLNQLKKEINKNGG